MEASGTLSNQIVKADPERIRNALQRFHGTGLFAAFDFAEIIPVNAAGFGEGSLCQFAIFTPDRYEAFSRYYGANATKPEIAVLYGILIPVA